MKRGGKGTGGAGAATAVLLLALLVLAASQADGAAAARRLGIADAVPKTNGCTSDPNKPGPPCHGHSPAKQAAARARQGFSLTPEHL